jgi:two-component system chemotaxis response regulator CheB
MTVPIRVVVADDSPFVCRLMTSYLQSSPDVQVVDTVLTGAQAVESVTELRPDVVTLDLEMPEMDGLEALGHIMHECPTPVVLVSGVSHRAAATTLQAIDMGAVDFILKYTPSVDTNPEILRQEIIAKVRAASRIKVVRSLRPRRPQGKEESSALLPAHPSAEPEAQTGESLTPVAGNVIVVGASTGGPVALRELLGSLPADFPCPIIIVQHMPASFTEVLASQLDQQVSLKVKEAEADDRLQPGLALLAPGGRHLLLRPNLFVELNRGPEIGGHRPSIDVTMQSAAQTYGARTKGIVLTGMGEDGLLGLVSIRAKGGKTFAQDAASCVVNGMPQRAIEEGVVDYVAPPRKIAELLRADETRTREK